MWLALGIHVEYEKAFYKVKTLEASDHCLLCLGFNAIRIYCSQEMKISLQKVVKSQAGADVIKGQSSPSSFERIEVKPTSFAFCRLYFAGMRI